MKTYTWTQWAQMLAENYLEDPSIAIQFRGVQDGQALLAVQCAGMCRAFSRVGGVTTCDDLAGIALGYFTGDEERLMQALQEEQAELLRQFPMETLAAVQQNTAEVAKIAQPNWYERFLGQREVYILQAIAVRKDLRGTGIFRKVISPVLSEAERRGIPVVLQAFEPDNVRKYEHMGFQCMETVPSETLDLTCYNLLKR